MLTTHDMQALDSERLLYTPEQASTILQCSRTELYREMARGNLRGLVLGRMRRFPRAELERYIAAKWAAQHGGVASE